MVECEFTPAYLAADPTPPTELGDDPHPISVRDGMVLIGVSPVWHGPPKSWESCPCCGNQPRPAHYCIRCDRWGGDGTRVLPGLPVGKYLDPEYIETD